MSTDDLDAIVRRAQDGDRDAFRDLVLALQRDLRIYLSAFGAGISLVEEVVQASFVTAYQKLHQYQPRGAFRAWLKTIARNLLLKELRSQLRAAADGGDALSALVVESGLGDLERIDEIDARSRRLHECLDRLAPQARALVEARYLHQQPLAEIAERHARTELWVRVTLCRIRKVLRTCLEQRESPA